MKFFTLGSKRTSSNNTCYSGAVLNPTALKTRNRFKIGSLLVLMIFGLAMLMPSKMNAQVPGTVEDAFNLPSKDRCTSKDLAIVSASLDLDNCSCNEGDIVYATLVLGIDNGTESTRTSFAFWSRVTLDDGDPTTEDIVYFIRGCQGPIPKASLAPPDGVTLLDFDNLQVLSYNESTGDFDLVVDPAHPEDLLHQIPYVCGSTLTLSNIYEGWTDASDNANRQCPLESSTINPKCGVNPEIVVNVGLTASSEFTDVSCNDDDGTSDDGTVTLTFSGGTAPYLVSFNGGAFTAQSSPKTYTGLAAGTYDWIVKDSAIEPCQKSGSETISNPPQLIVDDPADVTRCDSYILPALTNGNYFTGSGGTGTQLSAGDAITSTQTIYVYAETGTTPKCTAQNSFIVTIQYTPVADDPADVTRCDSYTLPALSAGNKYYTGSGGTGTELLAGASITTTQDIYVYAAAIAPCVADENVFKVTINTTPVADDPADVTRCDSYTLPALSAGNKYYTGSGGTGTELLAGASITTTQDIYVYFAAIAPCIADENVFKITINTTPVADDPDDVTRCDSYILPALSAGNKYYTSSGGTGTELLAGASITTTQDIYVYAAAIAPCIADENVFKVTINTTPVADDPADVEECDSYTLPALTNGNYFTGPGGTGTALFAGDIITSSQTIYVYSPALAPCIAAENSFIVTIKICVINEGCTLGYWKNHTDKWCAAYTTCTLYISIFEDSTLDPNLTLLQALNLRGNTDGENLARQSVAALLNTCSSQVGFFYSDVNTLIAAVNAAWTAGGSTLNTFATTLDGYNNAGCPLGGSRATTKPTPSCVVSTNAKESGNITLESSSKAEQFSAYPVPFKETLNIKYNFDYKSDVTIQIFDMRGQLMKTAKEANASKDKVTTLSVDFVRGNQVYIVRVTTDRESFFKQIISKE